MGSDELISRRHFLAAGASLAGAAFAAGYLPKSVVHAATTAAGATGSILDPGPVMPSVSVTDFGAVAEETDDSRAIQAAINSCLAGGDAAIDFPPGRYLITVPLVPSNNGASGRGKTLWLRGSGMHETTLLAGRQFRCGGMIGYGSGGGRNPIVARVVCTDMTLDGNYEGAGGTLSQPRSNAGALVSLPWPHTSAKARGPNGSYHRFERVRFYRPSGYGLQPSAGVELIDCVLEQMGQPDKLSLHYDNLGSGAGDAIVRNSRWVNGSGNYADFSAGAEFCRLLMSGCSSSGHGIGGIYACGQHSIIAGNNLANSEPGSGIGYDPATTARAGNIVIRNSLKNITVDDGGLGSRYRDVVAGNVVSYGARVRDL